MTMDYDENTYDENTNIPYGRDEEVAASTATPKHTPGDDVTTALRPTALNLIAAAPTMLAMLRRVLATVESGRLDWTGRMCCPFCEIPFGAETPPCELRAAIAKATGTDR